MAPWRRPGPELYARVYEAFFASCPDARASFAKTDLRRQYDLLHHAVVLMMAFHANPSYEEPTILTRVAARHADMQIPAEWFDAFSAAIRDAIASADPQYSDEVGDAWGAMLEGGTRYMQSYCERQTGQVAAGGSYSR